MSHIFISYSRKDIDFAQKIVDALAVNDLDTWIDWKSIPKGEKWLDEIYKGIEGADAFLFLISLDSVKSDNCNKEIVHAVKNNKRIIPVVVRHTDPDTVPSVISERNWIFCRYKEGEPDTSIDDFSAAIQQIHNTIHTDYEWLKIHTRLQMEALVWERSGKENSYLLHDRELKDTASSIVLSSGKEPPLTDLQGQYILASQTNEDRLRKNEERRRRRVTIGLILGLMIVSVLAVFAWGQRNSAITAEQTALAEANARATAQANAETEALQRATAQAIAVANAQEAQKQANIALARLLATQAQSMSLDIGSAAVQSGLLAVQAEKLNAGLMTDQALRRYLEHVKLPIAHMTHDGTIGAVSFNFDGKFVVSGGTDGVAVVWDAMTGQEISRMTHDGSVNSISFSPNGKYVVSGSADRTARVWESATGNEIARSEFGSALSIVAFSPDGSYVVSGDWNGYACVWEATTGRDVACMIHEGPVTSAVFSPDGMYVVSGGSDGTARVWEATTRREIARMTHDEAITSVAFSQDGKYVLSESTDWDVRLWEAKTGELVLDNGLSLIKPIVFDPDPIGDFVVAGYEGDSIRMWALKTQTGQSRAQEGSTTSVAFSQDGKYIVSGNDAGTAQVWEADSGFQFSRIIHEYGVRSVDLSPDGKWVVSGGCDKEDILGACLQGTAYVWANKSGNNIVDIELDERTRSFKFSPDGKFVVGLIYDNGYMSALNLDAGTKLGGIWDAETGGTVASLPYSAEVTAVSFSPDGQFIVSGSTDKTARVWEVKTGNELARVTFAESVDSVAFSSDGKHVVLDSGELVYLWDFDQGNQISFVPQHSDLPTPGINLSNTLTNSISISGDSKLLAAVRGYTVSIWDISTEKKIAQITQSSPIDFVSFTPDGRWAVTTVCDQTDSVLEEAFTQCAHATVRVWDPKSGKEVAHLSHDGGITSMAVSPNGRHIVSGGDDRTARVWDLSTGTVISRMIHAGSVDSLAFSVDGNYIVSAGCDEPGNFVDLDCLQGGAHVWEALTGTEVAHVTHNDRIIAVTFSSDGKYVTTGSADGYIKTWLWLANDLVDDACKRLPRNLTRAEWDQYIGDILPYQAVCPNLPIEAETTVPLTR